MSDQRPVLIADLLESNSSILDSGRPALLNLGKVQLVPEQNVFFSQSLADKCSFTYSNTGSNNFGTRISNKSLLHNVCDSLSVSSRA